MEECVSSASLTVSRDSRVLVQLINKLTDLTMLLTIVIVKNLAEEINISPIIRGCAVGKNWTASLCIGIGIGTN